MKDKILNFNLKDNFILKVINSSFDRSSCKKQLNWNEYKNKLVIHEIYYIGKLKIGTFK